MAILRDLIYGLVVALTSPIWLLSMLRTGKWRTDWRGRLGHVPITPGNAEGQNDKPSIKVMIHAVSLGEVNATREMVKRISEELGSNARIIITSTTNTGHDRAMELYGGKHAVLRYPFDFTRCVRRFLDAVQPDVVVLVELEVWPTFVEACAKRNIPVCVVNGRLSERSHKRYKLVRWLMKKSFASLSACAVQTMSYAQRFIDMGAIQDRVSVTDSMKWDTAKLMGPDEVKGVDELAGVLGIDRKKPVVVAGSTGPGEEEWLLRDKIPGVQLVLVPRKPERFEEVAGLISRVMSDMNGDASQPAAVVRRSMCKDGTQRGTEGAQVFLLDSMGELRKAYALADVVIIGRSFIDLFGSDPIEPIALGKPTVIGPRHGDFQEIVDTFHADEGIIISDQPWDQVKHLLADEQQARQLAVNGRRVILSRQGATQRHVQIVKDLLSSRSASKPESKQ